jgi:hypothetical protein
MGGAHRTNGEDKNYIQNFGRKTQGKKISFERRRHMREDILIYFREIRWQVLVWIYLAEDRGQ